MNILNLRIILAWILHPSFKLFPGLASLDPSTIEEAAKRADLILFVTDFQRQLRDREELSLLSKLRKWNPILVVSHLDQVKNSRDHLFNVLKEIHSSTLKLFADLEKEEIHRAQLKGRKIFEMGLAREPRVFALSNVDKALSVSPPSSFFGTPLGPRTGFAPLREFVYEILDDNKRDYYRARTFLLSTAKGQSHLFIRK